MRHSSVAQAYDADRSFKGVVMPHAQAAATCQSGDGAGTRRRRWLAGALVFTAAGLCLAQPLTCFMLPTSPGWVITRDCSMPWTS